MHAQFTSFVGRRFIGVAKDICRQSHSGWLLSLEFKVYLEKFILLHRCKCFKQYQDTICLGTQTSPVSRLCCSFSCNQLLRLYASTY